MRHAEIKGDLDRVQHQLVLRISAGTVTLGCRGGKLNLKYSRQRKMQIEAS